MFRYQAITLLAILAAHSQSVLAAKPLLDTSHVPGTVIAHYPKIANKYVGSPGLVVVDDGIYLAKHDEFGPGTEEFKSAITQLYRSEDAGKSWKHTHTFDGLFWASIFKLGEAVYLLGTDKHHGNIVIFRSADDGKNWTKPTDAEHGLVREGLYHTAPVPVVTHNGRIWRAIEDAGGSDVWGQRYRAMMMSAPVGADLLNASNWVFSNYVARDSKLLDGRFNAWLEGNAVVTPEDKVVNILRVDVKPEGGLAAIVRISDDGSNATFDPKDFIHFPGGATKFTIRHDPESGLYWTLCNHTPAFHRDTPAAATRNTLALANSHDLRRWTVRNIVLYHPDVASHAFQYVDWLFDGNDLIAVSRTAFDDGLGGAHRAHDANFLTFHRFNNFRKVEMSNSTPQYLIHANKRK